MRIDAEMLEHLSDEFDRLCTERHEMGAEKYGPVKFLDEDNNLFQMLREELIDASNYARYLFVRISLLEAMVANRVQEAVPEEGKVTVTIDPFRSWNNS